MVDSGPPFRLLRNIDNELPDRLSSGKDIDILVRWQDSEKLEKWMPQAGFHRTPHPFQNEKFLYGVHPFRFYRNNNAPFIIDCHFELACRSLNKGEWIPLDQTIQSQAWTSCGYHLVDGLHIPGLNPVCEWIHLLTRCVFDKRRFEKGYIRRIDHLMARLNETEMLEISRLVFFKFSMSLLALLQTGRYTEIIREHLHFTDY